MKKYRFYIFPTLDRLPEQLDHVHDFDGVVRVLLRHEFHKSKALVSTGDSVLGHVHVGHRPCVDEQLPEDLILEALEFLKILMSKSIFFNEKSSPRPGPKGVKGARAPCPILGKFKDKL